MRKLLCTLFFAAGMFSGVTAQNSQLPAVKIKDLKGNDVLFSTLFSAGNDTAIIISFWATWCGPCIKELEAIDENLEDWQKTTPVKVMAISVDDSRTASRVKPFIKGRGWNFEVYQDINNDLKRAFNIPNVPHTIVVKNGAIIFQHEGYVPGNEDEIIERIKKAGAARQ
jgi:cytochrome c biogenesis protein CcmG, thiol:disulfide interchange protein DsbE